MPPETQISAIAHVIQLAIAPVFLISGMATLLSVLANRLGRIVDRARVLEAQLETLDEAKQPRAWEELMRLSTRARLVNFAITFATVCALLTCITIQTLFLGTFLRINLSKLITVLFIAAMERTVINLDKLIRKKVPRKSVWIVMQVSRAQTVAKVMAKFTRRARVERRMSSSHALGCFASSKVSS